MARVEWGLLCDYAFFVPFHFLPIGNTVPRLGERCLILSGKFSVPSQKSVEMQENNVVNCSQVNIFRFEDGLTEERKRFPLPG